MNDSNKDANQWAMFVHFSLLLAWFGFIPGVVVPIILWQIKKGEFPIIDQHGKNVVNWIISEVIYAAICTVLVFLIIGVFLFIPLAIVAIVFPIIGGIKANNGEVWEYPLTIRFIK